MFDIFCFSETKVETLFPKIQFGIKDSPFIKGWRWDFLKIAVMAEWKIFKNGGKPEMGGWKIFKISFLSPSS